KRRKINVNEHVASDNMSTERGAESDVLRQVTPGEWGVIGEHGNNEDFFFVDVGMLHKGLTDHVARCYGATAQEALANARLMASAKDMAEALRPLAAYPLEDFGHEDRPDDRILWAANGHPVTIGHVRKARAALKKAGIE
ncbi:MAG: hypothetical protein ACRDAM_21725, partial [Casimicrobium sp.]